MGSSELELARPERGGPKPTVSGRALGLALARRIADTSSLLRQARGAVKRSQKPGRTKASKQLKRLQWLLIDVERDALSAGVTKEFAEDAGRLLSQADDHADLLVSRKKLKKRHLHRARKELRRVRRKLEALLSAAAQPRPVRPTLLSAPPSGPSTDAPL